MIVKGSVFSNVLGMETGLTVVTPSLHTSDRPYQVAYLLHGLCGSNGDWVNYTMLPAYANEYHVLFVMPEVARSFYTDMQHGHRFFTYVSEELPDICRKVFRISDKREDTAVIGASMGGYGALKCALSKPEKYGYCAAFSSACLYLKEGLDFQRNQPEECRAIYGEQLVHDFEAIFGKELAWKPEYEIMELAKLVSAGPVQPQIYVACGEEDYMRENNLRFRREMEGLKIPFAYDEWSGGHDWYFFNEALRRALQGYFGQ